LSDVWVQEIRWISYVRADMRALGITWRSKIRDCVSRVYELYHVHLNSTHSLKHVYEVFHTGVCLWTSLHDSFFWNVNEQCRLTYALLLLTHDLSLSRWSVRELASLTYEGTLNLCYDYDLYSEIDEPLMVYLSDAFSLKARESDPTTPRVANPFFVMSLLMKLSDHSHVLRPWSIHREWVYSATSTSNQLIALTYKYYERDLKPHLLMLTVLSPRLGYELYLRYSTNMERWMRILS
jgi:hypothetical protein